MSSLEEFRVWMAELHDLRDAALVLDWDQHTMMPRRGAEHRAETLSTLERIRHEKFVSEYTGSLLEAAEGALNGASPDSDEARLVAVTRRRWEKARRVPTDLAGEMARVGSLAQEVWVRARAEDDFAAFAPYLTQNIELARRYASCFEGFDRPYDVLLDDYEPTLRSEAVDQLFTELKAELVPLIARLADEGVDDSCLHVSYPLEGQRGVVEWAVGRMGFDDDGWRLDDAVHPFATCFGSADVRITTRWDENYFPMALYGAMHGRAKVGAIMGEPLRLTPSETLGEDFMVPADAEMVIEGHVLPNVKEVEGPFGEFTGYYGPQRLRNVIEVSAITHRHDAIFQHIFTGHRDTWVLGGIPKEGSLFNLIRGVVPTVKAVHFPMSGGCRFNCLTDL